MISVILPSTTEQFHLPEALREHDYDVTQSVAYGRGGERMILKILSLRKNGRALYKLINRLEPRAFIISHEPKFISGGFWTKKVRKRNDAISH